MDNNMRILLNGVVPGKNMELSREMENMETAQDEASQNRAIDEALGQHANEMTAEEREERLRETPKGTFEP